MTIHIFQVRGSCFTNGQHGVNLPDDVPHLVDDILKVPVLEGDLLDELVMFLSRRFVSVATLLLQLHSALPVLLQGDQGLDRHKIHATSVLLKLGVDPTSPLRISNLTLFPADPQPFEQHADAF